MVPENSIVAHRFASLRRFLLICGVVWGVGAAYLAITGRQSLAWVGAAESIVIFSLILLADRVSRHSIVNTLLLAMSVGLCGISHLSGGISGSSFPMFFAVVVLLAAYQMGARSAWVWGSIAFVFTIFLYIVSLAQWIPTFSPSNAFDQYICLLFLLLLVVAFSSIAEKANETYAKQIEDVTEELRMGTRKLNVMLGVDSLTKLPNRHQFQKDIQAAMDRAVTHNGRLAILVIDLNGFKEINDRFGHAAGDQVLRDVAVRLSEAVDPGIGRVARLGGDEFTVILEDVPDDFSAALTGGKIVRSISREYRFKGRELKLGASIGAATYPKDGLTVDDLMSHADAAMYSAKRNRLGVQLYCPEINAQARHKRNLADKLEGAIHRDEFSLFYQPQVNIRTGEVVGMESLLRWRHADGTTLSPGEFIAFLEDSGEIVEVGRWVLEQACREAKNWADRGSPIRVSVNVSSIQFRKPSFVDDVWAGLENSRLAPDLLDLELTETVFLDDPKQAVENIEMLRDAGVSISIDDFGTGYSSLAYLKALPINRLKIDRSFVKDIPDKDDGMIAEAVINLSHNLGMSVLAEGVDAECQLSFLRHRGCDEYQGYLFSKPISAEQTLELLCAESPNAVDRMAIAVEV